MHKRHSEATLVASVQPTSLLGFCCRLCLILFVNSSSNGSTESALEDTAESQRNTTNAFKHVRLTVEGDLGLGQNALLFKDS